ncbi:protein JASON isoform X2 [Arachis hypogaea]|uniref:protein JASON isoform X2 n=1 Tax=Arachis hypogaea TaxID=3818 RepID=UPI000DECEFAA|nr:protein JASON isoform X2 [Arachis hypogaea]QHO26860.1 Protein JASON [Arachis hypogaea]
MLVFGLVKRGLGFLLRFMLRFFFRSFNRAMGCFFACFRNNDNHRRRTHLTANSSSSTDVLVSRNSYSSVFQAQEREDCAINCGDVVEFQGDDLGLKDEAKFLKACGTLPGTPVEIRKTSEKLKVSPSPDKHSEPSRFHSWLPNESVEKLQLDFRSVNPPTPLKICQELGDSTDSFDHTPDRCLSDIHSEPSRFDSWLPNESVEKLQLDFRSIKPPTPLKICQELGESRDSFEHTPNRCLSDARDSHHESLEHMEGNKTGSPHTADRAENNPAPDSPWLATETQRKCKSVRFKCDTGLSSCGSSSDDSRLKKSWSPNNQNANKRSPYPTPLKLFDEMQTPGTVCPATLEELPNGRARVRSQFVYPTHKPDEDVFQRKILEEKDLNSEHDSSELRDSAEQAQIATPTPQKGSNQVLKENESKAEVSLSNWLRPAPIDQEKGNKRVESASSQIPHFRKTSADRPILGVAAAHFENEDSNICPPKWWDGNGIPNSTTKYKEKVKWHATPFEKRLEKALTEETFIPQRKFVPGKPMDFDDIEESDTALSQLRSSTNPESVESF